MSSWPQVREELLRLVDLDPPALLSYPGLDAESEPSQPFQIRLSSTALSIAEQLNKRFGSEVHLQVGALPYPPGSGEPWTQPTLREPATLDHSLEGIRLELDGPLEVESGATVEHALLVTNESSAEMTVNTNGQLAAQIVDLHDGSHVGGSAGFQRMPRVRFQMAPGETTRIPLLVGTDSYVPRLGYTIPPGPWGLTVDLDLGSRGKLRSPALAFDVVV
ncbi:MAG: hypothetical protein JWN96_2902 [Mycobacterium sp.]|nr:hypothetical protein [Mycobacterium sp.]